MSLGSNGKLSAVACGISFMRSSLYILARAHAQSLSFVGRRRREREREDRDKCVVIHLLSSLSLGSQASELIQMSAERQRAQISTGNGAQILPRFNENERETTPNATSTD